MKRPHQRNSRSANTELNRSAKPFGGLYYESNYISAELKNQFLNYLLSLHPIWEMRYSKHNPPPEGVNNRRLLRPVYWLSNWQFACLNYYHPPKGIHNRCLEAEPYPEFMARVVMQIESKVKNLFRPADIPKGWQLNTCLVNYYGDQIQDGKKVDCARVGEHKDFEPGPVASLSFGERALIQFVRSSGKMSSSDVVLQQWLEDCSLQIFGADKFKKQLFHRVQRVEAKTKHIFKINVDDFETRRINLTFRYVPNEHIQPLEKIEAKAREDILPYVQELAKHSDFFRSYLDRV